MVVESANATPVAPQGRRAGAVRAWDRASRKRTHNSLAMQGVYLSGTAWRDVCMPVEHPVQESELARDRRHMLIKPIDIFADIPLRHPIAASLFRLRPHRRHHARTRHR